MNNTENNEPVDEWPSLVADVDQHCAMAPELARMMHAEFKGLVADGMSPFFAAIVIGNRFRMSGSV